MCSKEELPKNLSDASSIPKQEIQEQPGVQHEMKPQPLVHHLPTDDEHIEEYKASGKLKSKIAIITGGDSGIGRSVAALFALESCEGIAIVYLSREEKDAQETKRRIEKQSSTKVELICKDIGCEENAIEVIDTVVKKWGRIDVLVNNASEQHLGENIQDLSAEQLDRTFKSNLYAMIFLSKHAIKHMKKGSTIINTSSVTAYKGHPMLIDYSITKAGIVGFTRSLSLQLICKGIRVNAVAPGPIWTPLIKASFAPEMMEEFGKDVPFGRAGQPSEVAPCYVFLASNDSSYMSGQVLHRVSRIMRCDEQIMRIISHRIILDTLVLHPNGGTVING